MGCGAFVAMAVGWDGESRGYGEGCGVTEVWGGMWGCYGGLGIRGGGAVELGVG